MGRRVMEGDCVFYLGFFFFSFLDSFVYLLQGEAVLAMQGR